MLSSRPVRNRFLAWKERGERVFVIFKRRSSKGAVLLSKIFRIPEEKIVELDPIGARVWKMCDGQSTVEGMIETLSEENRLEYKEAEVALLQFLKTLAKRGMIGFQVPTADEADQRG